MTRFELLLKMFPLLQLDKKQAYREVTHVNNTLCPVDLDYMNCSGCSTCSCEDCWDKEVI